jgi:hypothetical protein
MRTILPSVHSSRPAASRNSVISPSQKKPDHCKLPVQTKLIIGSSRDAAEHEAGAISDRIMNMPDDFMLKSNRANTERTADQQPLKSFIQQKAESEGTPVSPAVGDEIKKTQGG